MVNIAIVGSGTVGKNVIDILEKHSDIIKNKVGCPISIRWVCDKDLSRLKALNLPNEKITTDVDKVITDPSVDILVELIGGTEISKKIVIEAMNRGKHIVTANKAMLSKYWDDLFSLAARKKVQLYFEAAVGAGIPVIESLNEGLAANKILSIVGILNGTTNFILSKMTDDRMDFDKALKLAQKLGFAEANPSLDLDGSDAAQKLSVLASIAFGNHLPVEKIYREGISHISPIDVRYAKDEFGYVLKLLASVRNEKDGISATVYPTLIDSEHPLAAVENEYNAIYIEGDSSGDIMLYGKGAGGPAAASAVVSDIIYLARNIFYGTAGKFPYILYDKKIKLKIKPVEKTESKYYLRFLTADRPGVLSKISGILGKKNVSIAACFQEKLHNKRTVPIMILTHLAKEGNVRKAINIIDGLPIVRSKTVVLRIMK